MADPYRHSAPYGGRLCLLALLICFGLVLSGCKRKAEPSAEPNQTAAAPAPAPEAAPPSPKTAPPEPAQTESEVAAAPADDGIVLGEVCTWELDGAISRVFLRGQSIWCQNGRTAGATDPDFKSSRPLFGSLDVHNPGSAPQSYRFALDATSGDDGDYDLLYWDQDGDGDLTDDEPLKPQTDPPSRVLRGYSGTDQETCFAPIQLPCDFGPAGVHPVELLPHFVARGQRSTVLSLIQTKVRTGQFDVEGQAYRAYLGYRYQVTGRFDQPQTGLVLVAEGKNPVRWSGSDALNATHWLADRYYQFSCNPRGDRLFVRPYEGSVGTFELGTGDREVTELQMYGSLRSDETTVAVGENRGGDTLKPVRTCDLPTGDYYPVYLTLTFGQLQVSVSNSYYAEGQRHRRSEPVSGIEIREGQPFVLDFSNEPKVMFVEPAKGHRVARGEELKVEAVLLDPGLDIMLRRLYRVSKGGGRTSLDPKVTIKRTDGEVVAEGTMPFG